jgi:hypothetical protein
MKTNVVLDVKLVEAAFRYSETIGTKRELLETALREYVDVRKRNNIKDLRGKITFKSDYDYKAMRN